MTYTAAEVIHAYMDAQIIEAVALVVTSLPTDQRRAALDMMLQPLVQTAESLLTAPPPGSAALESGRRKELILSTFDRMALVFRRAFCSVPVLTSMKT